MNLVKYVFLVGILSVFLSCGARESSNLSSNSFENQIDSLSLVAKEFLWVDEYSDPNIYHVEEPDIEEVYQNHKEWIKKYFPSILNKYQMSFESKVIVAMYLHMVGEKQYLTNLIEEATTTEDKEIWEARMKYVKSLE